MRVEHKEQNESADMVSAVMPLPKLLSRGHGVTSFPARYAKLRSRGHQDYGMKLRDSVRGHAAARSRQNQSIIPDTRCGQARSRRGHSQMKPHAKTTIRRWCINDSAKPVPEPTSSLAPCPRYPKSVG